MMRKGGQGRGGNNFLPSISAPPPRTSPRLVTFLINRWGSPQVLAGRNALGWMPTGRLVRRHDLALRWYVLSYREGSLVFVAIWTYLLVALKVPLSSQSTVANASATVGSSLLDSSGVEPPSKRAHPWSFLPSSSRYARGANFCCMPFLLSVIWTLNFKEIVVLMTGAAPCSFRSSIGD
jgi:hypothetical protein